MSSRRTTRATSKQASSRGASPAVSEATAVTGVTATPRRASRRAGSSLSAVGTRTSSAYGANTLGDAVTTTGPIVSDDLTDVLQGILDPVPEASAEANAEASTSASAPAKAKSRTPAGRGGRRSRVSPDPSSPNRSFHHESAIFGEAGMEESPAPEDPELNDIPEEHELIEIEEDWMEPRAVTPPFTDPRVARGKQEDDARQRELHEIAVRGRYQEAVGRSANGKPQWGDVWLLRDWSQAWLGTVLKFLFNLSKEVGTKLLALILVALIVCTFLYSGFGQTFAQYVPSSGISAVDASNIYRRLNDLEKQITKAKAQVNLDHQSITKLEEMLPDHLVVKKDKHGNSVIPDDFWHALQDKIRSDQTIISDHTDSTGTGLSVKDVQIIAGKEWDKFIKANQVKMATDLGESLSSNFPQIMEKYKMASKSEVISLIREKWDENRKEVKLEMKALTKQLENDLRQIQKLQGDPTGLTKKDVRDIAAEVIRNALPHAQLEALVRSNLNQIVDYGLTRVNHFSKGTGAAIDPYHTSPNYVFPSQNVWFGERFMRAFMNNPIPAPKAPETAIAKWDEHGDCWCTPSKQAKGAGPQLGVITAKNIYPEQVVVEHISPSAALEPGAAPKEMELLAYIPDLNTYSAVKAKSDDIFGEDTDPNTPFPYVRISAFSYDINVAKVAQAFPVQLEGFSTNKFIVRPKSNWGGTDVPYTCIYRIRLHGEIGGGYN